jgi:hypothetical protein
MTDEVDAVGNLTGSDKLLPANGKDSGTRSGTQTKDTGAMSAITVKQGH